MSQADRDILAMQLEPEFPEPFQEFVGMSTDQKTWQIMRRLERKQGVACRSDGCSHDQLSQAVFCARHQYEALLGKLPARRSK